MQKQKKNKVEDYQSIEEQEIDSKEIVDDLDKLLEEIDNILEKNAEEFVENYVQREGE
jgi:ubiquitin-like protein Pup